jgi:hypothetical protein
VLCPKEGTGPSISPSNCLGARRKTRSGAGIFRNGETRTRTGDTTIFRDAGTSREGPEKSCKSEVAGWAACGSIPVVSCSFERLKDVGDRPRPFHLEPDREPAFEARLYVSAPSRTSRPS